MPVGSKTAPPLAKAEPISNGGNTFGVMYLRSSGERKDDFSMRNSERPLDPWREEPTLEQVYRQDLLPCGGFTLEQSVPEGLHTMEGTHPGAVYEELQPAGRSRVGEVHGQQEQGKNVRSPPAEDERLADIT
ncbi:hypothetical protein TURU_108121 [Turdus rufiventris]|nr:hypothetical protein TURU_108121 [Turdus rufiventris]